MQLDLLPQGLVNAICLAAVYAIIALGLTLVFGVLDIVNFAHGQLLLLAAYIAFELTSHGVNFWLTLVIVIVIFAVLGGLLEAVLFSRVRSSPINGLLISIGLIAVLRNVIDAIWGPDQHTLHGPYQGAVRTLGVYVPTAQLMTVISAGVVMILLAVVLRRSHFGRMLRATAQNREAAALAGIAVRWVDAAAFAIGTGLAALAGVLIAAMFPITPALSDSYLVYGFVALIIGGAGSPLGAVLGALVTGLAISLTQTYGSSTVASVAPFVVIVLVLLARPGGLVGKRLRASL